MATFGYSVGDFVAVAGLITTVVRSLRTAGGAEAVYRELSVDLEKLTGTLHLAKSLQSVKLEGHGKEIEHLQKACVACLDKITEFGKKMHKFQSTLKNSGSGDRVHEVKTLWHKIEWGVLREDQVKEFKAALAAPLHRVALAQQHILLHQGSSVIGTQAQILSIVQRLERRLSNDSNLPPAYERADLLPALPEPPSFVSQPDIDAKPWPYEDVDSKIREPLPARTGLGDVVTAFRVDVDLKCAEDVTPRTSYSDSVSKSVGVSVKEVWSRNTNSPEPSELLSACQERKIDLLQQLLQTPDISLSATDDQGHGVLHLALGTGKVNADKSKMTNIANTARLLSAHGADVNATDKSGLCPIHYCARTINSEAAKCLLEHGARINEPDLNGRTALNYTAMDSHPDVEFVKMLVARGGRLGTAKLPKLPPRANESQKKVRALVIKR